MKTPIMNRLPRRKQRERCQERGEYQEEEADAVNPDEVLNAERRNPAIAFHELEVGRRGVESGPQQQRGTEHDERHRQRNSVDQRLSMAVNERNDEDTSERQRDERRQHHIHR
jgi:hypothetical protein